MTLPWHTQKLSDVFDALHSSDQGLSAPEAATRLKADGPNALPETKPDSVLTLFVRQFQSPLIYLLFAASAIVFLMGETVDAVIILVVLIFNAIVGTIQEGKAENTLRALKHYVETNATVVRDGSEFIVKDAEVARGDLLILQEGEKVPADARVVLTSNLKIDEASLTGESEPVAKTVDPIPQETLAVSEQHNMVFKGTTIVSGSGRAVVVATGRRTFIGTIAAQIATIDSEIPLKRNIRNLSRAIIIVVGVISTTLFVFGLLKGHDVVTIFATVISLAVSIIPEGLPIVMTLVLATGVWRMSKRNALIKKLQAVEALGQARVIAVDKTGTITKNELVVREVYTPGTTFTVAGVGYEPTGSVELLGETIDAANHPELLLAGKVAALSSSARVSFAEAEKRWRVSGDPTEAAIRVFGEKVGFVKEDLLKELTLVDELPFDYKLKYHAVLYTEGETKVVALSGAPEAVLTLCTHLRRAGKNEPLTAHEREALEQEVATLSRKGLRVVAGALREHAPDELSGETVRGLTFVAFFGMQDALRPEVAEAMERATAAGIRVVMITGDHALTACAIAQEAGIWKEGDRIFTGDEVDQLSDEELVNRVADATVFARVTPEHKMRIVKAYKKRGEVIAMTGDGVNDAPPLVAADLGVAMGKIGTEVAKEAADIVLLDDNFGSIVSAVEEGRSIYKTIKKVMLYLFSTSLGEVLTITGALILDIPLPILAAQIIWLNFVTDGFLDVALAMEPKEEGLLSGTFHKPNKYIVDGLMVKRMFTMSVPMAVGALALFSQYYQADMAKAWTISLCVLAVFQWFNAWNCRSETKSVFSMNPFSNKFLVAATLTIIALQMLAVYTPFMQSVLRTVPLALSDWLLIVPVAASIMVVEEIRKWVYRRSAARKTVRTVSPTVAVA